jgi:outer membrane protein assembly factor BamB
MNKILNEPVLFNREQIAKIEDLKRARYVCSTERDDKTVEIFYSEDAHVAGGRYFGLYFSSLDNQLYITNGGFVEDQEISAVIADDGEIVYSRFRHDYRSSSDGSVFIDGGRSYTRVSLVDESRYATLIVKEGVLQVKNV